MAGNSAPLATAADVAAFSGPAGGTFIFDNAGANQDMVYWDANGGSGADAIAIVKLQGVTSLLPD